MKKLLVLNGLKNLRLYLLILLYIGYPLFLVIVNGGAFIFHFLVGRAVTIQVRRVI